MADDWDTEGAGVKAAQPEGGSDERKSGFRSFDKVCNLFTLMNFI